MRTATCYSTSAERGPLTVVVSDQCRNLLIMALSRINFFSLYFCNMSYALSADPNVNASVAPLTQRVRENEPYFHPRTSPHLLHAISRTVCRPVVIGRSSGSPSSTLNLRCASPSMLQLLSYKGRDVHRRK